MNQRECVQVAESACSSLSREPACASHHWLLDSGNLGVCKKCGAEKRFKDYFALISEIDYKVRWGYRFKIARLLGDGSLDPYENDSEWLKRLAEVR